MHDASHPEDPCAALAYVHLTWPGPSRGHRLRWRDLLDRSESASYHLHAPTSGPCALQRPCACGADDAPAVGRPAGVQEAIGAGLAPGPLALPRTDVRRGVVDPGRSADRGRRPSHCRSGCPAGVPAGRRSGNQPPLQQPRLGPVSPHPRVDYRASPTCPIPAHPRVRRQTTSGKTVGPHLLTASRPSYR